MIEQDLVFVVRIELSQTIVKDYQGTLSHRILSHSYCLTCLRSKKMSGLANLIRPERRDCLNSGDVLGLERGR